VDTTSRKTLETMASTWTPRTSDYSRGYWDGYEDAGKAVCRVPEIARGTGGYLGGYHAGQDAYRIDKGNTE
jgi:hypothetical protein